MDLGSILFLLAFFILIALFIAKPLLEKSAHSVTEEEHAASALLARRDRVLDALQELDFDYKIGKIPAADYPDHRAILLKQGAEILKQLDAIKVNGKGDVTNAALEAAIAARREQLSAPAGPGKRPPRAGLPDDEIETLLAARRRSRTEKSGGFCPQCGQAVQESDKFCSKCGATV